jgi:hypothetical protein
MSGKPARVTVDWERVAKVARAIQRPAHEHATTSHELVLGLLTAACLVTAKAIDSADHALVAAQVRAIVTPFLEGLETGASPLRFTVPKPSHPPSGGPH